MQRFFTFLELCLLLVFHIAQQEDEVAVFAGLQFYFQIVRGDGTPTVGNAVARSAFYYPFRVGKLVVESHECFAVGIKTVYGCIDTVEGVMIAAFLVFRLVVDDRPVHFHLSRGEVTLEVLHVRSGIPQAPFGKGE